MNLSEKKNLVIVRAGKQSLHKNWLRCPYAERDYDIIISYFDEEAFNSHVTEDGVRAYYYKGGKWDGLYQTISNYDDLFQKYEYFWLPDDDIDCLNSDINHLFRAMREYELKVAQPSLTQDSYFTYFLLLHCQGFNLRYTNFVEVMVPCLSRDVLQTILPKFQLTMSGFGLDYVWCRLPGVGEFGAGIVDEVQVHHTRPVGKVLLANMQKAGRNPKDEEQKLCAEFGVKMSPTPLAYAGITKDGRTVSGRKRIGFMMLREYMSALREQPKHSREFGLSNLFQLIRRQLTRPMDITIARSLPHNKADTTPSPS